VSGDRRRRQPDLTLDETGDTPKMVVDKEVIARTQIRLAERHWWLACMQPRKYGRDPDPAAADPPMPSGGDGAKEINPNERASPPRVIDEHPLGTALRAWQKAGQAA
jgi:hypothetical protein